MVCYTQPVGKTPLETIWKRAGTLKNTLQVIGETICLSPLLNFEQSDQQTLLAEQLCESNA